MARCGRWISVVLLAGLVLAAACSPEATRSRGGGPGADIGNRGAAVELHGAPPTTMFYRTPAEGLAAPMGGMVVAP